MKDLLEIHINGKDGFGVGYFLFSCDDYYIAQYVSPEGRFDGVGYRLTENISFTAKDTQYLAMIKKLMKDNNFKFYSFCSLGEMISYCIDNNKIVDIELNNSDEWDITGIIKKIKDDILEILIIDKYGYNDGVVFINVNDITILEFESVKLRCTEKVYKINY